MPTRSQVNTSINTKLASGSNIEATELRQVAIEQLDYVDQQDALLQPKETGKGLSTNDYTNGDKTKVTAIDQVFTAAEKTKLTGVATNATANSSDATLLNRANHTGTQTSATIADLTEFIQDTVAGLLGAGSNVILTYNDAAGTLEVSATGAGGAGLDAEQVRDAIGVALVGVGNIAVTVNDAADTITISTTATQNSTDAALRDRSTHTGTQSADTLTDGTTNKAFLATERTKLTGIATGATANSADATLLARANHTGTQAASTISDFATAVTTLLTWANISGKPSTFTPTAHSHAISEVTGLQTALDGKVITRTYTFVLGMGGDVTTGTNVTNQLTIEKAGTITAAYINAKTAPTGADLIVDINLNGTTIWSTQANRLKLTAGSSTGSTTTFNTTAVTAGQVLSIDVDQVGSTVAGQSITIQLVVTV